MKGKSQQQHNRGRSQNVPKDDTPSWLLEAEACLWAMPEPPATEVKAEKAKLEPEVRTSEANRTRPRRTRDKLEIVRSEEKPETSAADADETATPRAPMETNETSALPANDLRHRLRSRKATLSALGSEPEMSDPERHPARPHSSRAGRADAVPIRQHTTAPKDEGLESSSPKDVIAFTAHMSNAERAAAAAAALAPTQTPEGQCRRAARTSGKAHAPRQRSKIVVVR